MSEKGFSSQKETQYFFKNQITRTGSTSRQELLKTFNSQEKGIFILKPRYLRKAIQIDRQIGLLSLSVPHSEVYTLTKESFLSIAKYDLPDIYYQIKNPDSLPPMISLLYEPTPRELSSHSLDHFRYYYWALLFLAEIHKRQHLWEKEKKISEEQLAEFLHFLGSEVREEIQEVLSTARMLFNAEDLKELAYEFMGYFLQFYNFSPFCISRFFPSLRNPQEVYERILKFGLEEEKLLEESRPEGTISARDLINLREAFWEDPDGQQDDWFEVDYHLQRIYQSPEIAKWELTPQQFKHCYEGFLRDLLGEVLKGGHIVGKLTLEKVIEKAFLTGAPLDRNQILLMEEILQDSLPDFYISSSYIERRAIEHLEPEFLQDEAFLKPLKGRALKYRDRALKIFDDLETQRKTFQNKMAKFKFWLTFPFSLLLGIFLLPAAGFIFRARCLKITSPMSHGLFCFFFWQDFIWSLRKAFQKESQGNLARAIYYYKKVHFLLEGVTFTLSHQEKEELFQKLEGVVQSHREAIQEKFCTSHGLGDEDKDQLAALLFFLSERSHIPMKYRRILSDIQKSYVDSEKEYFRLNILRWLFTFGKQPLRKPLVYLPLMKKLRALKSIEKRLHTLKAPKRDIEAFAKVILLAFRSIEKQAREKLGRVISDLLRQVEIKPRPVELPEEANSSLLHSASQTAVLRGVQQDRIAFHKIRDEILDLLVNKYHTIFSDLRDVISRNDLMLHDLRGPGEFVMGDQLLHLDKKMSRELYGIHRGAEVYMRIIHRISSFLFGWGVGRWLSKYLLLPFGGAFMVYEAVNHLLTPLGAGGVMVLPIEQALQGLSHMFSSVQNFLVQSADRFVEPLVKIPTDEGLKTLHLTMNQRVDKIIHSYSLGLWIFTTGILLQFFFYTRLGWLAGKHLILFLGKFLKFLFWTLPLKAWNFSWTQALYKWRLWQFLHTFLIKPALYSFPVTLPLVYIDWLIAAQMALPLNERSPVVTFFAPLLGYFNSTLVVIGGIVVANGIINTPLGRGIFDYFEDRIAEGVYRLNKTVFIGLFHIIMDSFKKSLLWMEYILYRAEDFFRFQKGENLLSQFLKTTFGKLWYSVTYLFRFSVNLVIEPQVNPIKHFPIVTVSHKLVLPIAISLTAASQLYLAKIFTTPALFRTPDSYQKILDRSELPHNLIQEFQKRKEPLPSLARIEVREKGKKWILKGEKGVAFYVLLQEKYKKKMVIAAYSYEINGENPHPEWALWAVWIGVTLVFLFTQFGVPGICGFMAWEFRENWKLYPHAAPKEIQSVYFGSHGEDMMRLLRPGFHAGTLPKLYRKMRRAVLYAYHSGNFGPLQSLDWHMHHIQEDVQRFIERTFKAEMDNNVVIRKQIQKFEIHHPRLAPYRIAVPVSLQAEKGGLWNFELQFDYLEPFLFGYVFTGKREGEIPQELEDYVNYSLMVLWKKASIQILLTPLEKYLREKCAVGPDCALGFFQKNSHVTVEVIPQEGLKKIGHLRFNLEDEMMTPEFSGDLKAPENLETISREKFFFELFSMPWSHYNEKMRDFTFMGKALPKEDIIYTVE